VTELSPKQFIYGKLFGVLYNTKEMVVLPILLIAWQAITHQMSFENALYAIIDGLLLAHFSAMLGLHAAITYTNSRAAVANSLGTIFFLLIGIGHLCGFDRVERPPVWSSVAQLLDLHRSGQRRSLRVLGSEEPIKSDRIGGSSYTLLVVLLRDQSD